MLFSITYNLITSINLSPYLSYFISPTPDISRISSLVIGYLILISLNVPSPNIIYGAFLFSCAISCLNNLNFSNKSLISILLLSILTSLSKTFTSSFITLKDILFKATVEYSSLTSKYPWAINIFINSFKPSLEYSFIIP